MRKFLAIIGVICLALGVVPGVRAAEMVNVEYIHAAVKQKWGITVPYNAELANPKVAANVKYLLAVVDKANEIINGEPITDYVHGDYATEYAVDTVATNDAVARLIRELPSWSFTTTSNTTKFEFKMSAAGTFTIDWGDGVRDVLNRANTTETSYRHTYASAGAYTVTIKGRATGYGTYTNTQRSEIRFLEKQNLAGITGGLGRVFPTLADGRQPHFYDTFYGCTNLKGEIPPDLFDGIQGAPEESMFSGTFWSCPGLMGGIPENLFAGIQGAPMFNLFRYTFAGCTGLTGSIPENLFAGIQGAPAEDMFFGTFYGCTGLTGEIPANLFAGISGAPAREMFFQTFYKCSGLTSISENLFAGLDTTAPGKSSMFYSTFAGCTGLTGPSARINGKYLYEIWPEGNGTGYGVQCYYNATGLSDRATMPSLWK